MAPPSDGGVRDPDPMQLPEFLPEMSHVEVEVSLSNQVDDLTLEIFTGPIDWASTSVAVRHRPESVSFDLPSSSTHLAFTDTE